MYKFTFASTFNNFSKLLTEKKILESYLLKIIYFCSFSAHVGNSYILGHEGVTNSSLNMTLNISSSFFSFFSHIVLLPNSTYH